jgi:hypothetical protein
MRWKLIVVVAIVGWAVGCGGPSGPVTAAKTPVADGLDTEQPGFLTTPFTADQIRDEWVEGLEVKIRRWTPEAEAYEIWTVTGVDSEGAEITSTLLGPGGDVVRGPESHRSTWTELRDHASFPSAVASRERVRRETPLGGLDGWLYTVQDPDSGAESELFFAETLPGAPVSVHVFRGGELVEIFEQVERERPVGD